MRNPWKEIPTSAANVFVILFVVLGALCVAGGIHARLLQSVLIGIGEWGMAMIWLGGRTLPDMEGRGRRFTWQYFRWAWNHRSERGPALFLVGQAITLLVTVAVARVMIAEL